MINNPRKKLILPKILINDTSKIDSSLLHGNRYINKVNNIKTQFVTPYKSASTSSELLNIYSEKSEVLKDSICFSSSASETSEASNTLTLPDKFDETNILDESLSKQKRLSKSFNEYSNKTNSSLALPSPVLKRPRSKSEKVKSKTIKIFDKEEPNKPELLIENDQTKLIEEQTKNEMEESFVVNLSNNKSVIIQKSMPYNVDIPGCDAFEKNDKSNDASQTNELQEPVLVKIK